MARSCWIAAESVTCLQYSSGLPIAYSFQSILWFSGSSYPPGLRCCLYSNAFAFRRSDNPSWFESFRWPNHLFWGRTWDSPFHICRIQRLSNYQWRSQLCFPAYLLDSPCDPKACSRTSDLVPIGLLLGLGQSWRCGTSWNTCWAHSWWSHAWLWLQACISLRQVGTTWSWSACWTSAGDCACSSLLLKTVIVLLLVGLASVMQWMLLQLLAPQYSSHPALASMGNPHSPISHQIAILESWATLRATPTHLSPHLPLIDDQPTAYVLPAVKPPSHQLQPGAILHLVRAPAWTSS